VVSGFEGCLDVLSSEDAEHWIENDLKELILSFQDEYEGQAGLIFWVPSGHNRISMAGASERANPRLFCSIISFTTRACSGE